MGTPEEIERLVQEAERYKAEDEANRARVEAKNSLENYAFQMRNSINDEKMAGQMKPEDKEKEEYEEKQKTLEGVCLPILQSMGGGAGGMPGGMPGGGMPGGFPGGAPGGDAPAPEAADEGPKIEEID